MYVANKLASLHKNDFAELIIYSYINIYIYIYVYIHENKDDSTYKQCVI